MLKKWLDILLYLALLLVLVTPFLYSDKLYNGVVSAKQFWFYGIMALSMFIAGIRLLFRHKPSRISLNVIDISLLVFYIYFFIRAAYTPYTPLIHNTRFLNYTLLVVFYFIVKSIFSSQVDEGGDVSDSNKKNIFFSVLIIFLMLTGLVQAVWGLLQLYGVLESFHSGFKVTGTFFNPAPYALYLAVMFPIALSVLLLGPKPERGLDNQGKDGLPKSVERKGLRQFLIHIKAFFLKRDSTIVLTEICYNISVLTVISSLLILPATMNRASWLGVAVSSLYIINKNYKLVSKAKGFSNTFARKTIAFVALIVLFGSVSAGLFYMKKGSSDGRLLIWEVTLGKIAQKPLFGYGVGRFEAEYNNWQAEYFKNHPDEQDSTKGMVAGNTKYCFNEYLETTSELGIMGILLFFMIIISVFYVLKKSKPQKLSDKDYNNNPGISSLLISSLVSLLICALVSFPFYSLPTLIVLFILLAVLSSHIKEYQVVFYKFKISSLSCFIRLSFSIVLFSFLVHIVFFSKKQIRGYEDWNEAVLYYQNENYDKACKLFGIAYTSLKYTGAYLQYYGKTLFLNGEYSKSLVIMNCAITLSSNEALYTNLGDTYKKLSKQCEAEKAYHFAMFMVPHKLYPRYLLANLYFETRQEEKAFKTAEDIINRTTKVESQATREIKSKMAKLINVLK